MSARRFARRLAARLRLHVRSACRCPVCDEREQEEDGGSLSQRAEREH